MSSAHTQEFVLPNGRRITSVVLDEPEFMEFVDELAGILTQHGDRATSELLRSLKEARHLPLMVRGKKTERFFERWNVRTECLSAIVRGTGTQLLERMRPDPLRN